MDEQSKDNRCSWALVSAADKAYHDTEWGVPLHDEVLWFEFLTLEGAQAGLSWTTILNKREGYRQLYEGFDPVKVAAFDQQKVETMLQDARIVRNRLKVESSIKNAQLFLEVQREFGSFDAYIWQFVDNNPIQNSWQSMAEVPAITPQAEALSKDLKKRGFKFVGPTICYALMQATGLVNDHVVSCPRHQAVAAL